MKKNQSVQAAELRRRAEEQLRAKEPEAGLPRTEHETQRLLHELQVHQIELEMQNAEMCQARDEVETALGKYSDLYDFAPVGYLTLDRNGTIRAVNLTGATLLDMERSRLLGRRFGQFVAPEARPAFTDFLGRVFTGSSKVACEVALLRGEKYPFFAQIETVTAASGEECRAAIIDISKRRELETKLGIMHTDMVARAGELADANIELEAFNYTVSHDLCNPLTAINSYCQVLTELCGDRLDEQSKGYVGEIYEGTLRMKQLIASLLDFSRVTRVEIRREKCDLSAMAKIAAAELRLAAPRNRVTFRIAEGITGRVDAGLWRIVLNNLIGNAWKYTADREGTVIEFGVAELSGEPVYFVRDNGPGFDMAHASKLFIPFQRIPGIDAEGHGIGLATVQRIVGRHGGRVWAESAPGEGATFYLTLE